MGAVDAGLSAYPDTILLTYDMLDMFMEPLIKYPRDAAHAAVSQLGLKAFVTLPFLVNQACFLDHEPVTCKTSHPAVK
jgi:hypothetical protein